MVVRDVLLLNANYRPVRVVSWQRAVCLVLNGRVDPVEHYVGRTIRSPSFEMPWPAVVVLRAYVHLQHRVKFSRANVLARDVYTCQYCGESRRRVDAHQLTLDHVIPRARSKGGGVVLRDGRRVPVTSWENIVTSCSPCNRRKASRTPHEARMRLLSTPRRPSPVDAVRIALSRVSVPQEWSGYLPLAAGA